MYIFIDIYRIKSTTGMVFLFYLPIYMYINIYKRGYRGQLGDRQLILQKNQGFPRICPPPEKNPVFASLSLSLYIYILAASPLASSGFAAIGCFRASPYGGIYIMKNYSKLTAKKSAKFFFRKSNFFFA